jgi:hypothetical protein
MRPENANNTALSCFISCYTQIDGSSHQRGDKRKCGIANRDGRKAGIVSRQAWVKDHGRKWELPTTGRSQRPTAGPASRTIETAEA